MRNTDTYRQVEEEVSTLNLTETKTNEEFQQEMVDRTPSDGGNEDDDVDSDETSNKVYNLRCDQHASAMFAKNLFQDNDLTDVTLMAEGKQIKAHRLILSAYSPYFKVSQCHQVLFFLRFGS